MRELDSSKKNFYKTIDIILNKRRNKINSNIGPVINIIKDVKKNGDKALLKYEKKFNKNNILIPSNKYHFRSEFPRKIFKNSQKSPFLNGFTRK